IAIPAYQDYTVRARVTEGLSLAAQAKTLVAENAANAASDLSVGSSTFTPTKNVNNMTIDKTTGLIQLTFTSAVSAGSTLNLVPSSGGVALATNSAPGAPIVWVCAAASKTVTIGSAGTLAGKYAPSECR
ncbi:pilin, partial [Ralstonia solanacearum]